MQSVLEIVRYLNLPHFLNDLCLSLALSLALSVSDINDRNIVQSKITFTCFEF